MSSNARCRWAWRASCTSAATGVARGYLNRAGTDRRALPARPVQRTPDARMYRTGDLARWRADGNVEYLGRNDYQVKIRGLRIELGEIEARLNQLPGMQEAVVLAREDSPDSRAWWLTSPSSAQVEPLAVAELRAHLLTQSAGVHGAGGLCAARGVAADRQRQARPQGPAGTGAAALFTREYEAPQGELESAWRRSGPKCCRSSGSGVTTISSSSAGIRCWPCAWCRGCASAWAWSWRWAICLPTPNWQRSPSVLSQAGRSTLAGDCRRRPR